MPGSEYWKQTVDRCAHITSVVGEVMPLEGVFVGDAATAEAAPNANLAGDPGRRGRSEGGGVIDGAFTPQRRQRARGLPVRGRGGAAPHQERAVLERHPGAAARGQEVAAGGGAPGREQRVVRHRVLDVVAADGPRARAAAGHARQRLVLAAAAVLAADHVTQVGDGARAPRP
jgi:hypothetical protein